MKLLEMKFSSKQQKSRRKQAYFDKIKNNRIICFSHILGPFAVNGYAKS